MHLNELKEKKPQELLKYAESLGIENASGLRKQEIYFSVLKSSLKKMKKLLVKVFWKPCKTASVF